MSSARLAARVAVNIVAAAHASDLLVTLGPLARSLLTGVAEVALGLAIGLVAARTMRARQLHWTWAVVILVIVALVRSMLGGLWLVPASAALAAAVRGRRWHREDLDAGADLAAFARRRQRPLDWLVDVCRAALRVIARGGSNGAREQLTVGRDERGRAVCIPFGCPARGAHTLIVGATGSGKTITQTLLAVRAIERGAGVIVVDPKGDRGMRAALWSSAQAAGRRFIEWSPDGPSVYNPFARGSESEIADKLLAGEHFTEPHYQRQAQRYLGHAVRALRAAGVDVALQSIVDCLHPATLERLARNLPESKALATYTYMDSLTPRQQADLAGVRDRLAILAESDVGVWLDPRADDALFDLLSAARSRSIVYFDLQADSRPLLTQMLGAAILQDLQTTIAALQAAPTPTLAVIDEFSALATDRVVGLFARARSAGVSLVLGTQELSDLRLPGRESLLERVIGNVSVLIAHRQVVPDSAQLIAAIAPTRGAWRTSRHGDGAVTRTRTREGLIAADDIRGLATGWAAVITPGEVAAPRIAHIDAVTC